MYLCTHKKNRVHFRSSYVMLEEIPHAEGCPCRCVRKVAQLVAHYVRDVGVGRSSRLFPTKGSEMCDFQRIETLLPFKVEQNCNKELDKHCGLAMETMLKNALCKKQPHQL